MTFNTSRGEDPGRQARYAAIVAALKTPADIRALPLTALHLVMAMRLRALFARAGRDPVEELAGRFRSVTAAVAVLRFSEETVRGWPERFVVNRPCCRTLSPDEQTVAAMSRAAARGDRAAFTAALTTFVRADRHERLFAATVEAVASLQASVRG